jgi:protein-tyrosine phosphatase
MPEPLLDSRAVSIRRAIQLAGAPNFRDIGGHKTSDGMQVRYGVVFRSSELSRLSESDVAVLRGLGVRLVFDLRSDGERTHRPSRWPEGTATEHLAGALLTDIRAGHGKLRDILVEDPSRDGARRMMLESYRLMPARAAARLNQFLRRLAEGSTPAIIHCTAGKDRTGFLCACLLLALGVPKPTVYADYLLSAEHIDLDEMATTTYEVVAAQLRVDASREMVDVINSVAVEYLDSSFASVDQEFGSLSAYFEHCGVDAELMRQLRERLLEPQSPTAGP